MRLLRALYICSITFAMVLSFGFSGQALAQGETPKASTFVLVIEDSRSMSRADKKDVVASSLKLIESILPSDIAFGVVLASEAPEVVLSTQEKAGFRTVRKRIKKARIGLGLADYEGAFTLAAEMLEKSSTSNRSVVLVTASEPTGRFRRGIKRLYDAGSQFYVLGLGKRDAFGKWEEQANLSGGFLLQAETIQDLHFSLLETITYATGVQQIPAHGGEFLVDESCEKLIVVCKPFDKRGPSIIRPDRRKISKKSQRKRNGIKFTKSDSIVEIQLTNPKTGSWSIRNFVNGSARVFVISRHSVQYLLSRRIYSSGEQVGIMAYLSNNGKVMHLSNQGEQFRLTAEVLDRDNGKASMVTLADNGKDGDAVARDGLYSGLIDTSEQDGLQELHIKAESSFITRSQTTNIRVLKDNWYKLISPKAPLEQGRKIRVEVALNEDVPVPSQVSLSAKLGKGEELPLKKIDGHRFQGLFDAPEKIGDTELAVFKSGSFSLMIPDRQSHKTTFSVVEARVRITPLLIGAIVVLFLLINAAIVVVWLRRSKKTAVKDQPKTVEKVDEDLDDLDSFDGTVDMPEEKKIEQPERDELPVIDNVVIENVSERLGEVTAAHMGEKVQGDIDRPDLKQEQLDTDGDPELATGSAIDKQKSWLDDRNDPEKSEPEQGIEKVHQETKETSEETRRDIGEAFQDAFGMEAESRDKQPDLESELMSTIQDLEQGAIQSQEEDTETDESLQKEVEAASVAEADSQPQSEADELSAMINGLEKQTEGMGDKILTAIADDEESEEQAPIIEDAAKQPIGKDESDESAPQADSMEMDLDAAIEQLSESSAASASVDEDWSDLVSAVESSTEQTATESLESVEKGDEVSSLNDIDALIANMEDENGDSQNGSDDDFADLISEIQQQTGTAEPTGEESKVEAEQAMEPEQDTPVQESPGDEPQISNEESSPEDMGDLSDLIAEIQNVTDQSKSSSMDELDSAISGESQLKVPTDQDLSDLIDEIEKITQSD